MLLALNWWWWCYTLMYRIMHVILSIHLFLPILLIMPAEYMTDEKNHDINNHTYPTITQRSLQSPIAPTIQRSQHNDHITITHITNIPTHRSLALQLTLAFTDPVAAPSSLCPPP